MVLTIVIIMRDMSRIRRKSCRDNIPCFFLPSVLHCHKLTRHMSVSYTHLDVYKRQVLGCEVYVAPGSRFDRELSHGDDRYYHLVLLAENNQGYQMCIRDRFFLKEDFSKCKNTKGCVIDDETAVYM